MVQYLGMLTIQCETAHFQGLGRFTCRNCWTVTTLPNGMSALLMSLPASRVVFDAATGTVLHDCAINRVAF